MQENNFWAYFDTFLKCEELRLVMRLLSISISRGMNPFFSKKWNGHFVYIKFIDMEFCINTLQNWTVSETMRINTYPLITSTTAPRQHYVINTTSYCWQQNSSINHNLLLIASSSLPSSAADSKFNTIICCWQRIVQYHNLLLTASSLSPKGVLGICWYTYYVPAFWGVFSLNLVCRWVGFRHWPNLQNWVYFGRFCQKKPHF